MCACAEEGHCTLLQRAAGQQNPCTHPALIWRRVKSAFFRRAVKNVVGGNHLLLVLESLHCCERLHGWSFILIVHTGHCYQRVLEFECGPAPQAGPDERTDPAAFSQVSTAMTKQVRGETSKAVKAVRTSITARIRRAGGATLQGAICWPHQCRIKICGKQEQSIPCGYVSIAGACT